MYDGKLYSMALTFEKLTNKNNYITTYRKFGEKLNNILNFLNDVDDNIIPIIDFVGKLKEINPTHFQFQTTIFRGKEKNKFENFNKLVNQLSFHLGEANKINHNSATWEIVDNNDKINLTMIVYDDGYPDKYSIKTMIGQSNSLFK